MQWDLQRADISEHSAPSGRVPGPRDPGQSPTITVNSADSPGVSPGYFLAL